MVISPNFREVATFQILTLCTFVACLPKKGKDQCSEILLHLSKIMLVFFKNFFKKPSLSILDEKNPAGLKEHSVLEREGYYRKRIRSLGSISQLTTEKSWDLDLSDLNFLMFRKGR